MKSFRHAPKAVFFVLGMTLLMTACGGKGALSPEASDPNSKFRPGKPYQATYNMQGGQETFYWDGAGHIRMDVLPAGGISPKMVTVLDQNKNETIAWADGMGVPKSYSRTPAKRTDPLMILAYPMAKPTSYDSLGAKTIDGHNCHGWKGGLDQNSEIWLDDDCGCMVEMKTSGGSLTLSSLSTQAPPSSVFEPPPDFTRRAL